ncbi:hypothetical protein OCS_04400 [Ophiocordyceps sinensis CO18]|uniref:Uncharacterized protein n=1 Tax=Ophiocordyceps sinensis (strain Co18 / CGMCC 3.14243) TaxID=911162 RepID=T5ADS4_OPHSC|nr:hypothetical protein OCS_04400 [Ophiocordyceps sinensis CO18]
MGPGREQAAQQGRGAVDKGLRVAQWRGPRVGGGPGEGEARGVGGVGLDEEAARADGAVDAPEVVGNVLAGEEVVAVLAVGKVVGRQVGPVQGPPALVDAPGHIPLAQPRQVGCVIHAHLDARGPELGHQRRQQRRARRLRRLARASEGVGQHAEAQLWVAPKRVAQRLEQVALRLANVKRREEDASLGVAYAVLAGCSSRSALVGLA